MFKFAGVYNVVLPLMLCLCLAYPVPTALAQAVDIPLQVSSCSQTLKAAQKSYDQGQLTSIPEALQQCMANGFTKIEKLQAYRLLILTYLFLDEQQEAERWMNDLLNYEPDYRPNLTLDPIEYITLYNSYRILPVISLGFIIGGNRTNPRLVNDFGVSNINTYSSKYTAGNNFQFGFAVDWLLYRKLFITSEGILAFKNFDLSQNVVGASNLFLTESQTVLDIPISFKLLLLNSKLKIFVRAGADAGLLLTSSAQMIRKNTETNQNDYAGPNVDFGLIRNKLNISALGGIGLNYKLGYGYLTLDARYLYGLTNIANPDQRYQNYEKIISPYGYLDPDTGLNNIQVFVGYMYSIFKVKKKKSNSLNQ